MIGKEPNWFAPSPALRNTFTTRMLYTVLPSESYAPNGASLQTLMKALADDMNLLQQGFEAGGKNLN